MYKSRNSNNVMESGDHLKNGGRGKRWMSRGYVLKVLLFIVTATLLFSCNKEENQNSEISEDMLDEPMSEELLQFFESCPVAQYTDINAFDLSDAGLRSAEVQSPFVPLFREMAIKAIDLTNRSKFDYKKETPSQYGLAYVYGGKNYMKRMAGADKKDKTGKVIHKNVCQEELYGLDCSGFIYHILMAAGIEKSAGISQYNDNAKSQIEKLKKITEIKNNPYYNGKIEVKEIPINAQFNENSLRSGDIIYKQLSDGSIEHIGIILKKIDGTPVIFHSIGSYDVPCSTNKNESHGPIQSPLGTNAFGTLISKQPHILRFIDLEEYPPKLEIKAATNITSTSATLNGSLTIVGNSQIATCGFCWDTITYPTVDKSHSNLMIGTGEMVSDIKDLIPNKKYFVRAYGKMPSANVYYSDERSFTTLPTASVADWVLINGVKWATRNVGEPKTFVKNPEDYGKLYQWNRGTTDKLKEGFWEDYYSYNYSKSVYAKATSWLPENDPCPDGYRLPTLAEMQSLTNTTYVIIQLTLTGMRFTDKVSGKNILLPYAGYYWDELMLFGYKGFYWSSTLNPDNDYTSIDLTRISKNSAYSLSSERLKTSASNPLSADGSWNMSGYEEWERSSNILSNGLSIRPVVK